MLCLKDALLVLCLILNTEHEIKMYSWKPNAYMVQPYSLQNDESSEKGS